MQCFSCGEQAMRLTRYRGGLEIWGCRHCGAETPLLDCHCCERRGVHMAQQRADGQHQWVCDFCGHRKQQCRRCGNGWLVGGGSVLQCSRCSAPAQG